MFQQTQNFNREAPNIVTIHKITLVILTYESNPNLPRL